MLLIVSWIPQNLIVIQDNIPRSNLSLPVFRNNVRYIRFFTVFHTNTGDPNIPSLYLHSYLQPAGDCLCFP